MSARLATLSVCLIVVLAAMAPAAHAQFRSRYFSVNGSVGFSAEAYSTTSLNARRAPATLQAYANVPFNVLGFRSGVNLLYSTDESRVRQTVNKLGFSGSWRWVSLGAGDVSPTFSKYSLSGVTIRGGMLQLTPGPFMLGAAAGRSRRAVEASTEARIGRAAYEQWIYAAQVGFGKKEGSHFHLIGVVGRDDTLSVANAGDVLPQENLSITPDLGLRLFKGKFQLKASATVSAFTRDTRSTAVDDELDVPDFLTNLFTPRTGSRLDAAGEASMRVNLKNGGLRASYERVQPGFQSLGLARTRSDQESIRIQPQLRLLDRKLNLSGNVATFRNNLLGNRASTMERLQLGLTTQARLTTWLMLNVSYNQLDNTNTPADLTAPGAPSLQQDQRSQTVLLSPTLTLRKGNTSHSVSLSGSFQQMEDRSPAVVSGERAGNDFNNLSATLSYGVTLPSGLSLNASSNWLESNASAVEVTVIGLNTGLSYALFNRTLTLGANGGLSRNESTIQRGATPLSTSASQLMLTTNASYRLKNGDTIRITVRGLSNQQAGNTAQSYQEVQSTLRYEHRF
ncbi:MAG: hypothetical protein AAGJ10_03845 [Bacteroidota bacterium]